MSKRYFVAQRMLSLSQCERLLVTSSHGLQELLRSSSRSLPSGSLQVSVSAAIDLLVLSIAKKQTVEPQFLTSSLPGLRDEALLTLGQDSANWSFMGSTEAEHEFWPMFYNDRDTVRSRIAPLLNTNLNTVTTVIRFFSAGNIERLSPSQTSQSISDRTPRFSIYAHDLAARIAGACEAPMFYAKAENGA